MISSTLKWLEYVQLSSIPLRKLSAEKLPIGIASGCMIYYLNRRILLSVFHATGKEGNWAVELRFVKGKGTELYYPGAFNFLAEMTLGIPEIRDVDFSYTEIPHDVESYFQELTPNGEIISQRKRTVFRPTFEIFPTKNQMVFSLSKLISTSTPFSPPPLLLAGKRRKNRRSPRSTTIGSSCFYEETIIRNLAKVLLYTKS